MRLTEEDVVAEIVHWLEDALAYIDAHPGERIGRALSKAQHDAHLRDRDLQAGVGTGVPWTANFFAFWAVGATVGKATRETVAAVLNGLEAEPPTAIGQEVRAFVRAYLDGEIDDAERTRRLQRTTPANLDQIR